MTTLRRERRYREPGIGTLLPTIALGLVLALAACGEPETVEGVGGETPAPTPTPTPGPGATDTFERNLIFLGPSPDSVLAVPFSFRSVASAEGVDRELRGWLDRGGAWEAFFRESWRTGPTRVPWRLHPRGPIRLIAEQGDLLERIIFSEGARNLELIPGDLLSDFAGPRGETYRLQEGTLLLGEGRIDGYVLDASIASRAPAVPPSDLALLISGDSLHLVMAGGEGLEGSGVPTPWRAWARMDFVDRLWEEVGVTWAGSREFEPARRPVPDGWRWTNSDSTLVGELRVRSAQMEAVEADDPILPVEAVFEVEGTVTIEDREFPVHGIVRHTQRGRSR